MDNKKVSNLLRSIADLMDETVETTISINKEVVKNVEKVQEDFLSHSLKLMKRIEENDAVRAYQNKLTKSDKTLKDALEQIQKLREKAIEDMVYDAKHASNPLDLMNLGMKHTKKLGEQMLEEANIMTKTVTKD